MILENSISAFLVCAGRHCPLIQLSRVITIVLRHMVTLEESYNFTGSGIMDSHKRFCA